MVCGALRPGRQKGNARPGLGSHARAQRLQLVSWDERTAHTVFFSRRGARRARRAGILSSGGDRPGHRAKQRIGVASANVRSLKGDKFTLARHEFVRRNLFVCDVSEHWMTGTGILEDEATGFFLCVLGTLQMTILPAGSTGWDFCCLLSLVVHGSSRALLRVGLAHGWLA
jgi:hypothetical protein